MMKKWIALLLALTLAFPLAGCYNRPAILRDQLAVEQEITVTEAMKKAGWNHTDTAHSIHIPALIGESEAIARFNETILAAHRGPYDTLSDEYPDSYLFNCSYEYRADDLFVGILVRHEILTPEGKSVRVRGYYFDRVNETPVTAEEYLAAYGTSLEDLLPKAQADSAVQEAAGDKSIEVAAAILDEGGTVAAVFFDSSGEDMDLFEID